MAGMAQAVRRIRSSLERGKEILVYGDYDVDGITATVLLRRALEMLGARVRHHIPHRLEDGYGLKPAVLEQASADGVDLVVTVDCGIRDAEAVRRAAELGLDVIVTDHHLPGEDLPPAFVVLNPQLTTSGYPDRHLAGVGVAFKLAQALFQSAGKDGVVHHFLKMAAIGTIADMVPLVGENRVIVKLGLEGLAKPYNLGLQALLNGSGVGEEVDPTDIGFRIAPRINAFTRMGGGQEIVELFTARDPVVVEAIVVEMDRRNRERRAEEERILQEIREREATHPEQFSGAVVVVAGRGWHRGVLGNVAARLVQRFHKPALVVSLEGETGQGSARGVPGLHLLEILESASGFFERFGGHAQAVGCTVKPEWSTLEGIDLIRRRLDEVVRPLAEEKGLELELALDAQVDVAFWTFDRLADLEQLGPFGVGNPVPVFASLGVEPLGSPRFINGKHVKWVLPSAGDRIEAIWWGGAERCHQLATGGALDLAYTVSRNRFQGQDSILLTIRDLRS
jgi:single-stranded-DNA-specific exonuclease